MDILYIAVKTSNNFNNSGHCKKIMLCLDNKLIQVITPTLTASHMTKLCGFEMRLVRVLN